MVPVTRFALSDLPVVLLGGDPDVRGVWVPLFEDVPLHIPFLPSLLSRRDLVTIRGSVGSGDLASLAEERVCAFAPIDCARI